MATPRPPRTRTKIGGVFSVCTRSFSFQPRRGCDNTVSKGCVLRRVQANALRLRLSCSGKGLGLVALDRYRALACDACAWRPQRWI